jgi:nucleoside-diphosphate-sugar epimerase
MKVVITGGGGFIGSKLSDALLKIGELTAPSGKRQRIESIVLLDAVFPHLSADPRVTRQVCEISDREAVFNAIGTEPDLAIFHLASMVSGECELRFEDALRVNLDGGRNIFEAARSVARATDHLPRVIFASSIACFGGDVIAESFSDGSKQLPRTTYGMTKAICELLVNDYSRKGFFDGRSARLPTVIVRPGKPNAAASSWASGMFREPLAGIDCPLPIRRDQRHPMTGYRTVIDSLIALHELPASVLGGDRAVGLPAHQVTPHLAEKVLAEIAVEQGIKIGKIVDTYDERIQGIVNGWATAIDGSRGVKIGLPQPPPVKEIIKQYLEDFVNC